MITFEEIKALDGFFIDDEIRLFMKFGEVNNRKVEVGTWFGKSTIALASSGNPVITIDHHRGSPEMINNHDKFGFNTGDIWSFPKFWEHVKKFNLQDVIIPIIADNQKVDFINDIDFLFIDGAHDYENAMADYKHWFPKVKKTGTITVHDIENTAKCGSEYALLDYLKDSKWERVDQVKSVAVLKWKE